MKKITSLVLILFTSTIVFTQSTYVPDNNLETHLETHNANGDLVTLGSPSSMGNGIANDDSVTTAKIDTVVYLRIDNINITNLKGIEDFTALEILYCGGNQLDSFDISNNTALEQLYCSSAQLISLDVSNNLSLKKLAVNNNQLNTLDLSNNGFLTKLSCPDNHQLVSLNVKNGNNTILTEFNANQNPKLNCIKVDDAVWSTTNWTFIDETSSFSEDCILVDTISVQGQGNVSTITTSGGSLQMEATVLPTNAHNISPIWSVVNGTGSASISATGLLTATADGTVDVIATANDASGTTGTKTITISNQSVGIKTLAFKNLNIYPNPTNGIINLNVSETLSSVKLINITGKTLKRFNVAEKQLDISEFALGVYFLEILSEEKKSVIQIIKK